MIRLRKSLSTIAIIVTINALIACASIPASSPHNATKGIELASQARKLIGIPYIYGGNSLRGFDCSGMIQFAHKKVGINIPRTTLNQIKKIRNIKLSQLQPGDLIFFRLSGPKISHVGIYIGNNQMIHAPSSGKSVSYASLDAEGYWRPRIRATGRFY